MTESTIFPQLETGHGGERFSSPCDAVQALTYMAIFKVTQSRFRDER